MKKKTTLSLVLILFLCVGSVFATVSYSPSVQTNAGATFTFPTAEYLKTSEGKALPAMRTSFYGYADVMAANFKFNNFEIGAGASFLYNTRSLIAGNNFLRHYAGIGVVIGSSYHFKGIMALGGKFRYMFCSFVPYKNRFDVVEAEIIPAFDLIEKKHFDLSLSVPVTASLKTDAFSVRVGIGLNATFNILMGAKNEEN